MKTSVLLTWEVPENYKSQVPFKVRKNTLIWAAFVINNTLHVTVYYTVSVYMNISRNICLHWL